MSTRATGEKPKRGRPRSEKARKAILVTTSRLIFERDKEKVSMDAVAREAGVSKATIYRWWPSKEMLALDALLEWATVNVPVRDTGTLRGDLDSVVRPWVRAIRRRAAFGRVIAAFVSKAQSDPEFGDEYHRRFVSPRREACREAIERAKARGEVRAQLDAEIALDCLYGAIYHRLLHEQAPLSDRFARELVEIAVGGIAI